MIVTAGLGVLILLSLVLRTQVIGVGFWIDEGLSVGIADRPLGDIPDALRLDGSPPLYYVMLHFWMLLAGASEEGVRALSLLCALVAIPVAWWAAGSLFGPRTGWMAAILTATNPFLTQYAQEARMYALIALLALIAAAAFAHAYAGEDEPRSRRRWAIGFAVTLAAMLYTHNWALFFGAACGIAWLALVATQHGPARRELLVAGAIGFGGAFALYLPWIPTTLFQAAHTGAPWAEPPTVLALLASPGRMLGKFAQVALLLAAGAGLATLFARRAGRLSPAGRVAACLLGIAVLTVVLAWTASQISPAWTNRYLAVAVMPLLLAAAAGLAHAGRLGIAGVVVAGALAAGNMPPDDKSNVRDVAEAIAPSLRSGDLVVSTWPEQIPVLAYYLPDGLRYATLTGPVADSGVTDWRDGTERLEATSAERDLRPLMETLEPGRRMVLVQPIVFDIRRWEAPWTKLVRLRSEEWAQAASNDDRFAVTAVEPPPPPESRPIPVRATVRLKRPGA
ncbi:MAG: glycosyltransferase family 39 protein [Solirubrobacteraceae bacterium]